MQQKCWQPEEILANKYKIKRILGQSNKGISYEVEHFDWDMPLRLKFFDPEYWQSSFYPLTHALDRWISLGGFPHIVHAFYCSHLEEQPFLCTEYIPGVTLTNAIQDLKTLDECLDIAIQIGYALQECSQDRLIHNNLHPNNVLIYNHIALLEDFVGLPHNILPEKFSKYEIPAYARLMYFLFCSSTWQATNNSLVIAPGMQPRGFTLSEELANLIQHSADLQITNLDDIVLSLKTEYEKITGVPYKRTVVLSNRIGMEKLHKQAIAYYESKEISPAQFLWNFAGENSPASINALWNHCLSNLRQGLLSLDGFIRTLEDVSAFEHTQILYAQAELSLEVGCHIQDILERLEQNADLPIFLLRVKGEIFYRLRQYTQALECFTTVLKSSEHEPDDWYRLAVTHFSMQNWQQTLDTCHQGQQEYPNHLLLQLVSAVTHYCQGQIEVAGQEFQQLYLKYPSSLWIQVHLADFYAGKGLYTKHTAEINQDKAKQLYCQVLQIAPQMTRALRGNKTCGDTTTSPLFNSSFQFIEWSQIYCLTGHESIVTAIAMTPDSRWFVSGDNDGTLYLWAGNTGTLQTGLIGHTKHISSLAITHDGLHIASASWDYTIRIWESLSGSCLWDIQGHHDNITKIYFTPDGHYLISGSWDGTAQVWDVLTHQRINILSHNSAWVQDVALSLDGQFAVTCTDQEDVFLWDVAKAQILKQIRGLSICLSHDGKLLVTSYYNTLEVWEIPTFKQINCILATGKEMCLGLTKDNTLLLTKNEDDMLSFWDLVSKRKLAIFYSEEANCAVINYDGNSLITSLNTNIYLWENIVERPFPLFRHAHFLAPQIHDFIKTPEIVGQGYRNAEKAFQLNHYAEAFNIYQSLLKIPGYETADVLYSALNQTALRHPILRKNVTNILLRAQISLIGHATACSLAADGRIVLVGNDDDPIRQWNLYSSYVTHRWEGHRRCVTSIVCTADGRVALSGSWDGSVIFWQLDYPQNFQVLDISKTWITSVAINDTGTIGLAGTRDGQIFLINLSMMTTTELTSDPAKQAIISVLIKGNIGLVSLYDGTVYIFWLTECKLLHQHRPHERQITAMDASYEGRLVISSSRNNSILLWETESGHILKEFRHTGEVIKYIRLLNDRMFITLSKDGGLRIWCLDNPESLAYFYAHDNPITTAFISEDGRFLVSADENKLLKFWELEWEWRWEIPTTNANPTSGEHQPPKNNNPIEFESQQPPENYMLGVLQQPDTSAPSTPEQQSANPTPPDTSAPSTSIPDTSAPTTPEQQSANPILPDTSAPATSAPTTPEQQSANPTPPDTSAPPEDN